jgi:hypothetical protein
MKTRRFSLNPSPLPTTDYFLAAILLAGLVLTVISFGKIHAMPVQPFQSETKLLKLAGQTVRVETKRYHNMAFAVRYVVDSQDETEIAKVKAEIERTLEKNPANYYFVKRTTLKANAPGLQYATMLEYDPKGGSDFVKASVVNASDVFKPRMARLAQNKNNALHLPIGDLKKTNEIFREFIEASPEEIIFRITADGVTLHEASIGFYYLGQKAAENDDIKAAFGYWQIAAETYHNPIADVKIAKLYHSGYEGVVEKNLNEAYWYINKGFAVANTIDKNCQTPKLVYMDSVVKLGLGLADTFTYYNANHKFDTDAATKSMEKQFAAELGTCMTMYQYKN